MERLRQRTALDQHGWREFGQQKPRQTECLIEPLAQRSVDHQLSLFDLLGDFPDRDCRKRDPLGADRPANGGCGSTWVLPLLLEGR
jgi:hypothetical protein